MIRGYSWSRNQVVGDSPIAVERGVRTGQLSAKGCRPTGFSGVEKLFASS